MAKRWYTAEEILSKLRDELLNGEILYTLKAAKILIEGWRRHYNGKRPHSALGYRPPAPTPIVLGPAAPGSAMLGLRLPRPGGEQAVRLT